MKILKKFKKVNILKGIIILIFLLSGNYIFAGIPAILSMTMNPANPGWGQQFVVTMNVCHDAYNQNELDIAVSTSGTWSPANTGGQMFLVSFNGVDVHTPNPNNAQTTGNNMGYQLPVPAATPLTCDTCANSGSFDGYNQSLQFNLTMPQAADMGTSCGATTLYLMAAMKSANLASSDWAGFQSNACANNGDTKIFSWPLPTPPANSITLDKRVEGVLQSVGDLVLFSMDYTYGNGPLTITDSLPGGGSLALVSVGPSSINSGSVSSPGAGATSGTVTWTFPTSTYTKSGTVWILMRMTTAMASGTSVPNTANATSGGSNASASATLIVGQAAISVQKLESVDTFMKLPSASVTITYYLNYQVNGDQLKALRAFDDTNTGSSETTPPAGWKFQPYNTDNGTWTISDPCNTGDRILTGAGQSSSYPALLLDDPTPSNVQVCTGVIEADVFINPGTYPGADGLVILRNNGLSGTANYGYSLLLSIDTAPANGYMAIQRCGGGTACTYGGASSAIVITGNTWYRTKTYMTTNGTDYIFNSKIWAIGQPEPTGYQVSWTDAGAAATSSPYSCAAGATYTDWRPGVGNQSGDGNGTVQDEYNNFTVLVPRVAANAVLYDTVPSGLAYQGSSPGASGTSPVSWNLGNISDQSGSYTWWASTSACAQSFTNVGGIGATSLVPEFSNPVVFNVLCVSPTPTITPTPTPLFTLTKSASKTTITTTNDNVTFNLVFCNTSGGATQNFTIIDDWSSDNADGWQFNWSNNSNVNAGGISTINVNTNNGVSTVSIVPTPGGFTGCYTWQMWLTNNQHLQTCNWNNNASLSYPGMSASAVSTVVMHDTCASPTYTDTPTRTNTPNPSPTFTYTRTPTYTQTVTYTYTRTNTVTDTITFTPTNTNTVSVTFTRTYTPTYTQTMTPTPTPTFTDTASPTPTYTRTVTYTYTDTITVTPSPTVTYTVTNTVSVTDTRTYTPTYTQSDTPTPTPTFTNTMSPTPTYTRTVTYTYTNTITVTPTPTDTLTVTNTVSVTFTRTYTFTYTQTVTYTYTNTVTVTDTPTFTSTVTITVSVTDTRTFTPTFTQSDTPTPTPTFTNTQSPTPTYTRTVTYTYTFTDTTTVTMTDTSTITPTYTITMTFTVVIVSATITPTYTITKTNTPTDTITLTDTQTVTATATPTYTDTMSPTPTYTRTVTYTYTYTDTMTVTPTVTNTVTPTYTITMTFTVVILSATYTPTYTITRTNTPTDTITLTDTQTVTTTATPTFTDTMSPTPTYTRTVTYTSTNTATYTDTVSPTYTITMTFTVVILSATFTPTYTATRTITVTDTQSDTPTSTPTYTNTLSPTSTYTMTVTYTSTNTATYTNTVTPTYTITMTFTVVILSATFTPTYTATKTITLTYTQTDTYTSTATPTFTDTVQNTPTYTDTDTPTFTYTDTPTDTATPTYTDSPVDTPTYTPTVSPTPSSTTTDTPTYTDTTTDTPTFTSTVSATSTSTVTLTSTCTDTPVDTPTYTSTSTSTYTSTLTQTYTYTDTITLTVTYTDTRTMTATNTATNTLSATITYTDTNTQTVTITITPIPFPYVMNISVYNEAGELVKTIASTTTSQEAQQVQLLINGSQTAVVAPGSGTALTIKVPGLETPDQQKNGYASFTWDGTNSAGQNVANGEYYIKETTTDPYGHTDIITKPVSVINESQYVQVNIFNSAGELVQTIITPYNGSDQVSLSISNTNGISNYVLPVGKGSPLITIGYTSSNPPLTWDGKNSQGDYLQSGVYEVQLVLKTKSGFSVVASKSITILDEGSSDVLGTVKTLPNPYTGDTSTPLVFTWQPSANGVIKIKIYNIAGELVRTLVGDLGAASINWDLKSVGGQTVSSGTYICVVEGADTTGNKTRKIVKLSALIKNMQ